MKGEYVIYIHFLAFCFKNEFINIEYWIFLWKLALCKEITIKDNSFCIVNLISYFSYVENSKFGLEVSLMLLGLLMPQRFVSVLKKSLNVSEEGHFVLP